MRPPLPQPPVGAHSSNPVFAPKGVLKRPHPNQQPAIIPGAGIKLFDEDERRSQCHAHSAHALRKVARTLPCIVVGVVSTRPRLSGDKRRGRQRWTRAERATAAQLSLLSGVSVTAIGAPATGCRHMATDLTAQHGDALVEGGDAGQVLTVLCRACNSRHAAVIMAPYRKNY